MVPVLFMSSDRSCLHYHAPLYVRHHFLPFHSAHQRYSLTPSYYDGINEAAHKTHKLQPKFPQLTQPNITHITCRSVPTSLDILAASKLNQQSNPGLKVSGTSIQPSTVAFLGLLPLFYPSQLKCWNGMVSLDQQSTKYPKCSRTQSWVDVLNTWKWAPGVQTSTVAFPALLPAF